MVYRNDILNLDGWGLKVLMETSRGPTLAPSSQMTSGVDLNI